MADPQYVIQSLSYPLGGVPIIAHLRVRPMSELTPDDFVLAFPIGMSAEFTNARVMRVSEINLIDFGPVEEIVTGELTHLATFSGYADLNSPRDLVIIGDILYVGTATSDSVASFNISDPLHIALLDSFTDSELNMTLGLHRITDDILLAGSAISNNLLTLDVSDPSNITKIASIHDSSAFSPTGDSGVHNGHAFVLASNNRLITSVDVSNPSSLSITQSLYDEVCYLTSPPVFSGDVMFFTANTTHNLVAYDISDPANMTEISRIVMPDNYPNYVALSGSYAFVVTGYSGNFYTVDISDPANMSIVGGITDVVAGQTKVWVFGDIAYTCDNVGTIRSVDISDPENPTVAYQRLQDTDVLNGPEGAAKSGVNLFMTGAYGNQVAVFSTGGAPALLDVAVAVATKGSSVKCEDMRYFMPL